MFIHLLSRFISLLHYVVGVFVGFLWAECWLPAGLSLAFVATCSLLLGL